MKVKIQLFKNQNIVKLEIFYSSVSVPNVPSEEKDDKRARRGALKLYDTEAADLKAGLDFHDTSHEILGIFKLWQN